MILRGMWLLARGRTAGLREFTDSLDGFTASLAPLIAFPLVGAGVSAMGGDWELAIIGFLSRLCAVLALPLIIHEFSRRTGREALWLRTATALDWSFWLLVPTIFVAAFAGAALVEAGVTMQSAEYAALGFIAGYLVWLHWFVLRAGLQVKAVTAAALVVVSGVAVAALTLAPFGLNYVFTGQIMPA